MPKAKKQETGKEKTEKKVEEKKLSQLEYEKMVLELGEKGMTSEKIGESLRRQGIHPKEFSKKMSRILKDKNLYKNPDVINIGAKLEKLKAHHDKNKHDRRAMRDKERISSQLRKLKIYFDKKQKISA